MNCLQRNHTLNANILLSKSLLVELHCLQLPVILILVKLEVLNVEEILNLRDWN